MTVEKPRIRGRVSTPVAPASADKVRAAARAAFVVSQGRISDPACLSSHESDVLFVTRYLFPTSRPSFPCVAYHISTSRTRTSAVLNATLRSTSSGIFSLAEQPNAFSSVASNSLRARVCASHAMCVRKRVYTCVHRAAGGHRWRSATLLHCCLHEIPSNFELKF